MALAPTSRPARIPVPRLHRCPRRKQRWLANDLMSSTTTLLSQQMYSQQLIALAAHRDMTNKHSRTFHFIRRHALAAPVQRHGQFCKFLLAARPNSSRRVRHSHHGNRNLVAHFDHISALSRLPTGWHSVGYLEFGSNLRIVASSDIVFLEHSPYLRNLNTGA